MIITYDNLRLRAPDFLIVGAARSGTTTLYSYLSEHRDVFMPDEKEPMFFYAWGDPPYYSNLRPKKKAHYVTTRWEDYFRLFERAKESQIIGEASTWYLYGSQRTIDNIKRLYGEKAKELKIIISLRNPAERAWSHYGMKKREGTEDLDFEEAIKPEIIQTRLARHLTPGFDYIGMGLYFEQVKTYQQNFEQVQVFLFEDLVKNVSEEISNILHFLGIDSFPFDQKDKKMNVAGSPKNAFAGILDKLIFKPNVIKSSLKHLLPSTFRRDTKYLIGDKIYTKETLDNRLKQKLLDFYREDILRLAQLIQKDLSPWLQTCNFSLEAGRECQEQMKEISR